MSCFRIFIAGKSFSYADLVSYAKQPGAGTFIAKPDASSQGRGIVLFQDPLKTDFITSETNDLIVQKYVDRPFLLDGKKFDFRVYVLVSSCEPLEAYIYTEGLARFAVVPYAKPSGKNLVLILFLLCSVRLLSF